MVAAAGPAAEGVTQKFHGVGAVHLSACLLQVFGFRGGGPFAVVHTGDPRFSALLPPAW
jgi:hypothetical protein